MDLPEFSKIDDYFINGKVDFVLNEAFPQEPTYSLQHLLEYRVKLLLQENIIIAGGVGSFEPRKLALKEAEKFEGKSIFYSVTKKDILKNKNII